MVAIFGLQIRPPKKERCGVITLTPHGRCEADHTGWHLWSKKRALAGPAKLIVYSDAGHDFDFDSK
jgi:hypothetical protein